VVLAIAALRRDGSMALLAGVSVVGQVVATMSLALR